MVSYEQKSYDSQGYICLKNNTQEIIHNVVFRLTYYDMKGNQLDYADFKEEIDIEPDMARRIAVKAFGRDSQYCYYKSDNSRYFPSFDVSCELIDYNVADGEHEAESNRNDGMSVIEVVILIALVLFVIGISFGIYVLVGVMAKNRKRSVIAWVLLSIFISPIFAIILLLCLGKDEKIVNYNGNKDNTNLP